MDSSQPIANSYREVAIRTANPLQLVVILYEGAIHALQEAQEHLRRNDISNRARCVGRAVAMISELQACLNFDAGGNIANSLDRLYNYMKHRIFQASVDQQIEPLAEVITLLENLRSAWSALAKQSQTLDLADQTPELADSGMLESGTTASLPPTGINISG